MAKVQLWIPITGDGSMDDPYRPNVPDGVSADVGSAAGEPRFGNPESPKYGHLVALEPGMGSLMLADIDEKDAAKIKNAVADNDVALQLRLAVEVGRMVRRDHVTGALTVVSLDAIETMFDDKKPEAATPDGEVMLKNLLYWLGSLGLPQMRAEKIAANMGWSWTHTPLPE